MAIAAADVVGDYISGVMSGRFTVGRLTRLAVSRHVADLETAGERGFYFNERTAAESVDFFPAVCRHSTGEWAGQVFELSPWQAFITWCLFGWRRESDDTRRFRKAYISVARKNGKSTLGAGLAWRGVLADDPIEPRAEVYGAATTEDQANIIHSEAERMVLASPTLNNFSKVRKKLIRLEPNPWNGSLLKPLGSDSKSKDGLNPHGIFMDELHAWTEHYRDLFEKLGTGGASRRQPLQVIITTAGSDRSPIWLEEEEYAQRVVEAHEMNDVVTDSLFAFVASLDDKDDPFDEANWPKSNPGMIEAGGSGSVKIAYLREQAHEALKKPTAMNQWLRYHCNVKTASSEKAIRPGLWTENAGELRPLENRVSYGGFDLGRANDWAAIALVFPVRDWNEHKEADETTYDLIAHCFSCQEGAIDWRREPYSEWRRSGLVTVSQGNQVDFGAVERKIIEWTRLYSTQTWDYDPTFAGQMGQRLLNNFGIQVHMMYQTCRNYNEPIRHMLSKLELQSVRHGGDPVLAWQAGNLTIRRNTQDEWMPDKGATTAKIDAMVAALMAFSGAIYGEGASNYEDRGFRTL